MPNIIRAGGGTVAPLIPYLYNLGDECTALTGGWSRTYYTNVGVTLTKNASDMTVASSTGDGLAYISTANPFDFTNYTKLKITFIGTMPAHIYHTIALQARSVNTANSGTIYASTALTNVTLAGETTIEVDVSSVNLSAYPNFLLNRYTGTISAVISKIWVE